MSTRLFFIVVCAACMPLAGLVSGASGSPAKQTQGWQGVPSKLGVFAACYQKTTGAMRVTPAFKGCRRGAEFRMTWGQKGSAGPAGPPEGPRGSEVAGRAWSAG